MCFIAFSYKQHSKYKLIFCANRDEFYNRKAVEMHFWPENDSILAGKDVQGGGTWLGITKKGKLAALTNFREQSTVSPTKPSRGQIVKKFLEQDYETKEFIDYLKKSKSFYEGYNLIFGTIDKLYYFSNRSNGTLPISPGLYGLSNATLDTPWPKIKRGKALLAEAISKPDFSITELFNVLTDNHKVHDDMLPDTGISPVYEKELSPIFVNMEHYGTRSSTVILVDYDYNANVYEQRYDNKGKVKGNSQFCFKIESPD